MKNKTANYNRIIHWATPNKTAKFLRARSYYLQRDTYRVACALFGTESALRLGYEVKNVVVEISIETYARWPISEIENLLNELIAVTTFQDVEFKLIAVNYSFGKHDKRLGFKKKKKVVLFSGGIDSTTGLLCSAKLYGEDISAISVIHADQGNVRIILRDLINEMKPIWHGEVDFIHVPQMFSRGYSQLRGFLYVICAAVFADLRGANEIIIAECGPTMYQTKFGPLDSITMTTHPYILRACKKFLQATLRKDFSLKIPFENMTKAEVVAINPMPIIIRKTHSCISSRWIVSDVGKHTASDGTCYGCVIRHLGSLVANVPDTIYGRDAFTATGKYSDAIRQLISFSLDVLTDYKFMPHYTTEIIDEFNKLPLFRRFALDNLAAVHIVAKSGREIDQGILVHYNEALEAKYIGSISLNNRIKEVRSKRIAPNYRKEIK